MAEGVARATHAWAGRLDYDAPEYELHENPTTVWSLARGESI